MKRKSGEQQTAPAHTAGPDSPGLVVLSNTDVELSVAAVLACLDAVFPGQFLPPRQQSNFVIDGEVEGVQFLLNSTVPGASGLFLLHTVPGPYTLFSNFAAAIADSALRRIAVAQQCWLSIDLLTPPTAAHARYSLIAPVLARLSPADAAVLLHPSQLVATAFTDEVRRRLTLGDPVVCPP